MKHMAQRLYQKLFETSANINILKSQNPAKRQIHTHKTKANFLKKTRR